MKNYQNFSSHDFALDDFFQSWVFRPDEETNIFWKEWIKKHPSKEADIEEARIILNNFSLNRYTLPAESVSSLWTKIQQRNSSQSLEKNQKFKFRHWYWAAAVLFLLGLSGYFLIIDGNDQIEFHTQFGETKTILLPDSSTVILNANSKLTYSKKWNEQPTRSIWLDGQAFFSVVHKQDHQPFKVNVAGGVAIEVLGTTFDVYHRSVETKVALNSGQITMSFPLNKSEKKILMKPGELVDYKKDNYTKSVIDPLVYAAWTEKKIILNQTSLEEMILMAKDNYGIDIEVESPEMLKQTVSGSMPLGDADNFVNQVAMAFQMKIIREENSILFKE